MEIWLSLARGIDRVSRLFGILAAWLVLPSCLISAGNATSRYIFAASSNAWLEIQWQMFAGIFLLGSARVLKLNEDVRVDLVYGSCAARSKLWIDTFGIILFLFPAALMMAVMGAELFLDAFRRGEMSCNARGLPLWPVKALPLGFELLILQGIAELIKRIAGLNGHGTCAPGDERPLQ